MNQKLERFTGGRTSVRNKLNALVDAQNNQLGIIGDTYILVTQAGGRIAIKLAVETLLARIPKTRQSNGIMFCRLDSEYTSGETAAAKLCDAAGTLLSPAVAITLHAGWTLADGCQIETDQIIPVTKSRSDDDEYYAVGMPKDVVVDIRLVDSPSTNTLKVQKKLRTDFGAFHTSVSDWIDATGATTTGPFECPEDE